MREEGDKRDGNERGDCLGNIRTNVKAGAPIVWADSRPAASGPGVVGPHQGGKAFLEVSR